jgi:hypothetical protein
LKELGGESDTVEVHRFGHWGPGWFEIILAHPSREAEIKDMESRLENYPILDEDDHSERQWEKAIEWWGLCGMRERIRICAKYRASIFAARRDEIPENVELSYLADGC